MIITGENEIFQNVLFSSDQSEVEANQRLSIALLYFTLRDIQLPVR